jgi:hypothetical protein
MDTSKLLYSRKEAAGLTSLSLRSIDHLIASGKLQTRRLGKRVLVTAGSLFEYAGISDATGTELALNSRSFAKDGEDETLRSSKQRMSAGQGRTERIGTQSHKHTVRGDTAR